MSYDALHTSRHDGSAFELYRFETEDNLRTWLYTTDSEPFVLGFETFRPELIQRSEVKQGGENNGQRLEVNLPWDNPVAALHVPYLPPRPVKVTIYTVERRDSAVEVKQCFIGYVTSFGQDGPVMKLQCSHIIDSTAQMTPWVVHKAGCVWSVYGEGCGVLQALYESTVQAGSFLVSGDTITSTIFAEKALVLPDWFRSGKIYNPTTGEKRFITEHTGNMIRLVYPFIGLDPLKHTLIAAAGCAGLQDVCHNKFNNKRNYLGFDHMPEYNVFDGGVRA
jgi:hypothetical protein